VTYAVGERIRLVHVVGGQDDCAAFFVLAEEVPDCATVVWVQAACRLVENDYLEKRNEKKRLAGDFRRGIY